MKKSKGISCIEGIWNEHDLHNKLSVLPMLELLKRGEYCDYIYHDCATNDELYFFLKQWKLKKYIKKYPILYFAFHGNKNCIMMAKGKKATLEQIAETLEDSCKGTVIFFASCDTLDIDKRLVLKFLNATGAVAAIGYKSEVDWIKSTAFEMILFDAVQDFTASKKGMYAVEKRISENYGQLKRDLDFRMVIND